MLIRAMARLNGARASENERGRRDAFVASRFGPAAAERSQQPKGGRSLRAVG